MHFLKALFWVLVGALVVLLGVRNWHDVTLNLWGDIQVDIKTPILLGFMVLIGWLPTYLLFRTRLWRTRSRLDSLERQQADRVAAEPTRVTGPDA